MRFYHITFSIVVKILPNSFRTSKVECHQAVPLHLYVQRIYVSFGKGIVLSIAVGHAYIQALLRARSPVVTLAVKV
jgi:hypothetical protein